jgi:uncharacterized protein (TIGR02996 family)
MSEEAAFIAALVADPSDRTAALVFADWLDERGDPRGPMLRNDAVRALLAPSYENPLAKLRAALETGKGVTEASKRFAQMGETAVPVLVSLLAHEKPIVRLRAVKALGVMGTKATSAIPALTEMVKGSKKEDDSASRQAVALLGVLRAKEAVKDELAKGLDSADTAERLTAVEAMAKLKLRTKSAGSSLCKALADESDEVRRAAAQQLRYIAAPSMPFAVEPLRQALSDRDGEIRSFAAVALGKIGPKASAAAPDLLRLLNDPAATDRRNLVDAVVKIGVNLPEVLDVVLAARRDPGTAQVLADALTKWRTFPPAAVPALRELVRDVGMGNGHYEIACVHAGLRALGRIVPRPPEVLEELRAQLATDNAPVAAEVLGGIGPPAAHLLPDLLAALHRLGKGYGSFNVAQAIGKIGGEGIPALAKLIDRAPTKDDLLPAAAAAGLAAAGAAARPALPELLAQLKRLREQPASVGHTSVIQAIVAIGADAAGAVPDLVGLLLEGRHQQYSSSWLVQTLQQFGPAVLPFVPQLTDALRQPIRRGLHESIVCLITALIPHGYDAFPILQDVLRQAVANYVTAGYTSSNLEWRQVAGAAVEGLAKLGPAAEAAVPDLLLADQTYDNWLLRRPILAAYGKIGGAAIPQIRAALGHPSPEVRLAAAEALGETADTSAETRNALRALGTDPDEQVRAQAAALLQKM